MIPLLLPAVCATAAAVGLQVLLPRLFSVVLWYHLGFFAVSLAMLGFALGGVLVRRRALRAAADGGAPIGAGGAAAFASLTTSFACLLVVRLPIEPTRLLESARDPALLLLAAAALAIPFTALGSVVCAVLERSQERLGAVYGATFAGGAIGALLALCGMEYLGAPRTVGLLALLPLLAARGAGAAGPALAGLVFGVALLVAPESLLPLHSRKHFPVIQPGQVLAEEWNAFSRVTFYANPERHGLWEMAPDYNGSLPQSIGIAIDAWAITSILRRSDVESDPRFLDAYPPTLAYANAPPGFDALVIGAGGGVDVLGALHFGAGHVTAVEINPLIVAAVQDRFGEFAGDLYRDPRVTAIAAEGRAFVDHDDRLYDRIVLSGVDTFAATEAGAFALSENYLYTVEALQSYYRHLKPGGILAMTRWWFDPPRQTLRLALTANAALLDLGCADPGAQMFIAVTRRTSTNSLFLLKKGDFEPGEIDALVAGCQRRGSDLVYAKGRAPHPIYAAALAVGGADAAMRASIYRVDPTTDERPFFFENSRLTRAFRSEGDWIHHRLGGLELLLVTLGVLALLSVPVLWLGLGGSRGGTRAAGGRVAVPFLLLGFAYMAVEVPLLQRLSLPLGHPVYAVSVALVGMMIGSGAGAWFTTRLAPGLARATALAAAVLVVAVLVIGHAELIAALAHAALWQRVVVVLLYLALPSFVMGMPFALAIRAIGLVRPDVVPIAFVANGVAAVLAGPLVVLLAMESGFNAALLCAAVCYVLAALLLPAGPALRRFATPG